MRRYAKFDEYEKVRLREDKEEISECPFTQLDIPRAVTRKDTGIIVMVHDVDHPDYEVEFFDETHHTVDVLTVHESEIELWPDTE